MNRWDDPKYAPDGEPGRIARYRRLQSWYREVQLGAEPAPYPARRVKGAVQVTDKLGLGSLLRPEDVAAQPDLNFLHPDAAAHADERVAEVRAANGTLEEGRLRHNLLSSMPLCFNLFGALRNETGFLALFQNLFDVRATSINDVICEWAPAAGEGSLGDRTAFDAVVFYERSDGPAFLGIETKYTEPFSQKVYKPSGRYREITEQSGWFSDPVAAPDRLKASASNQLWRNLLLSAALELDGGRGRGGVAVVALADDPGVARAADAVSAELDPVSADRLRVVSLEAIVSAAPEVAPGLQGWADRFRRRYLDVDQSDDAGAKADPAGPRLGRPLTRP